MLKIVVKDISETYNEILTYKKFAGGPKNNFLKFTFQLHTF